MSFITKAQQQQQLQKHNNKSATIGTGRSAPVTFQTLLSRTPSTSISLQRRPNLRAQQIDFKWETKLLALTVISKPLFSVQQTKSHILAHTSTLLSTATTSNNVPLLIKWASPRTVANRAVNDCSSPRASHLILNGICREKEDVKPPRACDTTGSDRAEGE